MDGASEGVSGLSWRAQLWFPALHVVHLVHLLVPTAVSDATGVHRSATSPLTFSLILQPSHQHGEEEGDDEVAGQQVPGRRSSTALLAGLAAPGAPAASACAQRTDTATGCRRHIIDGHAGCQSRRAAHHRPSSSSRLRSQECRQASPPTGRGNGCPAPRRRRSAAPSSLSSLSSQQPWHQNGTGLCEKTLSDGHVKRRPAMTSMESQAAAGCVVEASDQRHAAGTLQHQHGTPPARGASMAVCHRWRVTVTWVQLRFVHALPAWQQPQQPPTAPAVGGGGNGCVKGRSQLGVKLSMHHHACACDARRQRARRSQHAFSTPQEGGTEGKRLRAASPSCPDFGQGARRPQQRAPAPQGWPAAAPPPHGASQRRRRWLGG